MSILNQQQVEENLQLVPAWRLDQGSIRRDFVFPDFVAAMKFVNQVAGVAETAGHHPDIDIRWNKVSLVLVSHDAGGLTERDFGVAANIDRLS